MTLAEITVRKFMAALFNKQRDGIDDWDGLYLSYIDLSGIGETHELSLMTAIHNLQVRLAHVNSYIDFQRKFFSEFFMPYEKSFPDMHKYNIRFTWNPMDPEGFIRQMKVAETNEKRNIAELDLLEKELRDIKKGAPAVKEDHNSRANFIRMLNSLNKAGYKIDKDLTDMEEVCLMIRAQREEYDAAMDAKNKPD